MNTSEVIVKGLVIRLFNGAYILCDGKCPDRKEEGEIYVGTVVGVFDTWEEADKMRKVIDATYQ